jgi:hypothetical protein
MVEDIAAQKGIVLGDEDHFERAETRLGDFESDKICPDVCSRPIVALCQDGASRQQFEFVCDLLGDSR